MGTVDNAIRYGVRDGRFREFPIPTRGLKLRAEDDGAPLVPGVDPFQQIAGLSFRQENQHAVLHKNTPNTVCPVLGVHINYLPALCSRERQIRLISHFM